MTTIPAQPDELETIEKFIKETEVSDHIAAMEENIALAVGFTQRVGSLLNDAECDYAKVKMTYLEQLASKEEETETTRKAKLEAWTADAKRNISNLKLIKTNLRTIQMMLMQAIKTRREEMAMTAAPRGR